MPLLSDAPRRRAKTPDLIGLAGFVLLSLAVLGLGGAITATSVVTWYPTLAKPAFTPPDWLFGPMWTILYLLMAVAGWRIWRRSSAPGRAAALTAYGIQLGLNLGWSFLFFGFRLIGLALAEIALLLVAVAVTTALFWRIDRPASLLFLPYLLWLGYAAALNAALWRLN
ncbi:MAG: tryptophan-rich sensory protein [Alphaproteobacteria bacterium]|nr:tryptophan-rich sensory protein [Alphaproteobacteria bacterium]